MNQQMFLEITSCCAGVATMSAPERLFTRMNQHVALEVTCSSAGIVAMRAVERFFCVFPHALLQGCVFCAGVAALATPVRLLYIMFTSFLRSFAIFDFRIYMCCFRGKVGGELK